MALASYIAPARWFRIVLMLLMGMIAIYAEAAPLGLGPNARPSPDLLLCVVAFWAIRRPGSTPLLAVFALGLIRDLLTDVPVGAGVLSLVLAAELLKVQRSALARSPFVMEWLTVSGVILGTVILHWLLVVITLAQPPYLADLANQCLYTIALYPLLVLTFRWFLRIGWRKPEVAA